jgi:hypothetical protein
MCGQAKCHARGASCGCIEVLVFFVAYILTNVSKLMDCSATANVHGQVIKFFSTFSVLLLVPGHPEHSSSSTDTHTALERKCHSKTAVCLKELLQKLLETFQGFQE